MNTGLEFGLEFDLEWKLTINLVLCGYRLGGWCLGSIGHGEGIQLGGCEVRNA